MVPSCLHSIFFTDSITLATASCPGSSCPGCAKTGSPRKMVEIHLILIVFPMKLDQSTPKLPFNISKYTFFGIFWYIKTAQPRCTHVLRQTHVWFFTATSDVHPNKGQVGHNIEGLRISPWCGWPLKWNCTSTSLLELPLSFPSKRNEQHPSGNLRVWCGHPFVDDLPGQFSLEGWTANQQVSMYIYIYIYAHAHIYRTQA